MANVKWHCPKCGETFEGAATLKKCPDPECQSKDIYRIENEIDRISRLLKDGGAPTGAELLADIILQDPDNVEHVWETLKDHKIGLGVRRTIMKAYFRKNSKDLRLDDLERGETLQKEKTPKTPQEDDEQELENKRQKLRELRKMRESRFLDQQIELEFELQKAKLLQITGEGDGKGSADNSGMQPVRITRQEGWLDDEQSQPNFVTYEYPYNPMFPMQGMMNQQPGGQPPMDPLKVLDKSVEITKKLQSETPKGPVDDEAIKELKSEMKNLQNQLHAKELETVKNEFDAKLAQLKEDQAGKTKEQIEAETGKELVSGIMGTIQEQQKSHNTKIETLLEKGLDIYAKKQGGKDEIVKGSDLESAPSPTVTNPPPEEPPAPPDPRKPPPNRR